MRAVNVFVSSSLVEECRLAELVAGFEMFDVSVYDDLMHFIVAASNSKNYVFIVEIDTESKTLIEKFLDEFGSNNGNSTILILKEKNAARVISYLRMGAMGVLCGQFHSDELLSAIETVARGKRYLGSSLLLFLLERSRQKSLGSPEVQASDQNKTKTGGIHLTEDEVRTARLLVEGRTITWIGEKTGMRSSSVFAAKASIYRKTGSRDLTDLSSWLFQAGHTVG